MLHSPHGWTLAVLELEVSGGQMWNFIGINCGPYPPNRAGAPCPRSYLLRGGGSPSLALCYPFSSAPYTNKVLYVFFQSIPR